MAMTLTDLRNKIKTKLDDWYVDETLVDSTTFSGTTVTSLATDDGAKFKKGDLIEFSAHTEVCKVTDISTDTLTVIRGYMGTTAEAVLDNTPIYIINDYSKQEINDAVKEGFRSLFPHISVPYKGDIRGKNKRITLNDCDAVSWTAANDSTTATLNTTDQKEGSACLNLGMTYSAGKGEYLNAVTAQNCTDSDYLNLWLYLGDKQDGSDDYYLNRDNAVEVRIGSHASAYSYMNLTLDQIDVNGWTLLNIYLV